MRKRKETDADSKARVGILTGDTQDPDPVREILVDAIFERRKGTRRLRMSFDFENRLVVRMPWNCSLRQAREFVEANREWIGKQANSLAPVLGLEDFLIRNPSISLEGRRIAVSIHRVNVGSSHWIYDERRAEGLFHLRDQGESAAVLKALIRKVAVAALTRRVAEFSDLHRFRPGKVTVRDQKSRWGSCSHNGTISLNWRLLLLSPGAQDYVILHELAHLRHLNHSRDFYELLSDLDPNRSAHEDELTRDGPRLMRVGR